MAQLPIIWKNNPNVPNQPNDLFLEGDINQISTGGYG